MAFYVMRQDTSIEGSAIVGGFPDQIDASVWIKGKPMLRPGDNLVLDLSEESGDYRGHILEGFLLLYHDQLKEALDGLGVTSIDYHPVRLRDPHTMETEGGYNLVDILAVYDCIDLNKSKIKRSSLSTKESDFDMMSLAIDAKKTNGAKIFRLQNIPTLVIINQELKDYFDETDLLVGVDLIQTESYSEW